MKYFLLHNRRHLGPYALEELKDLLQKNSIPKQAYVISEENSTIGKLNYQKLTDLLDLSPFVLAVQEASEVAQKPLLPDSEIKKIEQNFNESVDPLELVTPGTSSSSQVGSPRDKGVSSKGQMVRELWTRFRNLPPAYVVLFLGIVGILLVAKGLMDRSRKKEAAVAEKTAEHSLPSSIPSLVPENKGGGGALSNSLNLGPAHPSNNTIEVPTINRSSPVVEETIEEESHLEQGETPEPSLIKKKKKPTRLNVQRDEEVVDSEEDLVDGSEREPAGEEGEEEGEEAELPVQDEAEEY